MKHNTLKICAILSIIIGTYLIFKDFKAHIWYFSELVSGKVEYRYTPLWILILSILAEIIIILRFIAGVGLYKIKNWGRNLSFVVFAGDLAIRMSSYIYTWTYYSRHPEAKGLAEEAMKQLAESQAKGDTVHVGYVSMIPSYVIAFISLVSLILLICIKPKDVKQLKV